jgi:hypothetical protein
VEESGEEGARLISIVSPQRLERILRVVLDEAHFLSPYGLRSVSKAHGQEGNQVEFDGQHLKYEPGESTGWDFAGNSNWRGPVWFPVNYLVIEALVRYHRYLGDSFTVHYPTSVDGREGPRLTLAQIADDLSRRLTAIFLKDESGRRPVFGDRALFSDPLWNDLVPFHEYFHGETGAGLGASHQTGWTGLVADLIRQPPSSRRTPR